MSFVPVIGLLKVRKLIVILQKCAFLPLVVSDFGRGRFTPMGGQIAEQVD